MTPPVEKGMWMGGEVKGIWMSSAWTVCKTFDTVFATKVMIYGFGECTVRWIRNRLEVYARNVADNHTCLNGKQ